ERKCLMLGNVQNVHLYQVLHDVAAGRVEGVDPIEQIAKRCIRIVKDIEAEIGGCAGGCALCRGSDFSRSGFGPRTIIICDQ
ncbi:chromodomain-helicase-DNA-binding protein, partial [Trifolium medium]|nr:chromodomain-helicase-DNA-binding protein [Trifolium medium]